MSSKMGRLFLIWLAGFAALSACTRGPDLPEDPKRRLTDYISRSFSVRSVDERQALAALLTGDAKVRLKAWSDEQFREAFVEPQRQFVKLTFREAKAISPQEMNITYEVTYMEKIKDQNRKVTDREVKVTNRKLCQLVLENSKWLIADFKNIKELVEYGKEMAVSSSPVGK